MNFEDLATSVGFTDGDLTDAVVVNGADEVDLAATGDYTIIYEVEDAAAQKVCQSVRLRSRYCATLNHSCCNRANRGNTH